MWVLKGYCAFAGVTSRECSSSDRVLFNSNLVGLFTEEYQRAPRLLQRTVETKGLLGW